MIHNVKSNNEQEVKQEVEEEKKETIDMKKSLALKMSSHQEKISESCCKDEENEIAMVVKRCKKLVLKKSHRMGRGNNSNNFMTKEEKVCNNDFVDLDIL